MANIKPAHMKKDSNPYRQKKNEEQKHAMKAEFKQVDLMKVPRTSSVRNKKVYKALITQLKELNLSIHLNQIDIQQLIQLANSIDLYNEAERELQKTGLVQTVTTREGTIKIVANPLVAQRNTFINEIDRQYKTLQLDPKSRQLLTEAVNNDLNMLDTSDAFDDDEESWFD